MQRKRKGEMSFKDMFKDGIHDDAYCEHCLKSTNHRGTISYSCNPLTRYIIIRMNLSNTFHNKYIRYKMRVKNFNPDKIEIPGIQETFKLKSAILHESLSNSNDGHYTALIRSDKKWFSLSDTECTSVNFNEELKDFYVLLLEKQ